MRRLCVLLGFVLLAAASHTAVAADPATGNWKVAVVNNYITDTVLCIVKIDQNDGKWTAELVASHPNLRNVKIKSVTVENGRVRLTVLQGDAESVFEGTLDGDKSALGCYGNDRRISAAKLLWTEDEKLDQKSAFIRKKLPTPMEDVGKLESELNNMRGKIRTTKDEDEKKTLTKEFDEKKKSADGEIAGLLRKTVAEHADDPAAFDAAMQFISGSTKYNTTADDARKWTGFALAAAAKYGPRYRQDTQTKLAEDLVANKALHAVAVEVAKRADAELGPQAPAAKQVRVLTTLVAALGASPEAKPFAERLDKLETVLDNEYLAKHAKLEVEPYGGRKSGANRTMMLELFTGAQCPPCVAADIAFDKLCEKYKPEDVILLQYHMHIPGPDPMTNADNEARWAYYQKAFPYDPKEPEKPSVRGVPCPLFNGGLDDDRKHDGGGPESNAGKVLKEFCSIIDPVLDEETKTKLSVKARRTGDVVTIDAAVADLAEPGSAKKLRFALVEETIRYTGGNGIRFHHHVVRALPGGADGITLAGANETRQVTVNLTELRGTLTKYLDDFVEKRGPFPKPQRPLDMKRLKAVAWVQDDNDDKRTVLNAIMVDVTGASKGE